ncbi:5578_t:CDS:2, partial [Gigaspora margarita]
DNDLFEIIPNNNTVKNVTTTSNSVNIASNVQKNLVLDFPLPLDPFFHKKPLITSQYFVVSVKEANKPIPSQQLLTFIPEDTISNQILTPAQKAKFSMLVAEWIVSDTLPFSVVSSQSFATMIRYLNANIDLPSRDVIKSIIQKAFTVMQRDIQLLFEQISSKISITLDIWTSRANVPFICITAHWIDNNWNLKNILLDICMLPHPHTGEEINAKLCSVFAAFNITNKILCATTDGGTNMVLAMRLLKDSLILKNCNFNFQPRRCLAHILNLIVTTRLSPIKPSIEKVRNFVNIISSLSSITQDFKELGQMVGEGESTRKISQDVSNYWNSTYLILSAYVTMPTTISAIIRRNKNLEKFKLTPQDKTNLQVTTQFLKPFYKTTNVLSGSTYTTLVPLNLTYTEQIAQKRRKASTFTNKPDELTQYLNEAVLSMN